MIFCSLGKGLLENLVVNSLFFSFMEKLELKWNTYKSPMIRKSKNEMLYGCCT